MKPGSIALISVNLLLAVLVPDAAASQGEGGGLLLLVLLPILPVWLAGRFAGRTKAADIYRVWYGTNRRPDGSGFSSLIDDAIHYGFCDVKIPKGHKFGSIGSSRFRRWLQRLMTSTDDALAIADRRPLSRNAFLEAITLRLRQEKRPSALVYIHVYNVSFETAGVRAAQIGFDLKVPGVTAFFSWPSKGEVDSYLADSDSIDQDPERRPALDRCETESGEPYWALRANNT
jgi:esterase/lipase superfamily enzyme